MTDKHSLSQLTPIFHVSRYIWTLTFGFIAVIVLFIIVTWYSSNSLKIVKHELEVIVDEDMQKIMHVTRMGENARLRIMTMYKMLHMDDPFERDDADLKLNTYAANFSQAREELISKELDQLEKQLLADQGLQASIALPLQREFSYLLADENFELAEETLINHAAPAHHKLMGDLNAIYQLQIDKARAAVIDSKATYNATMKNVLLLSGITLFIALFIIYTVIIRSYKMTVERESQVNELELLNKAYLKSVKELSEANQKANAANEAKSTFLANMSHEIRTPLTAIIGFSDVIMDNNQLQERDFKSISTISRSGKHLLSIINEILDISKIEAGKLEINTVDVCLFELLDELQPLLNIHAEEKGLGFQINYNYPLPETIHTDPTRLKQILLNLCNNAIKFTMQGSVSINVHMDNQSNLLTFTVIDTGIGIAADKLAHIFSSFTQEDSSTTRNYGGTGLGLYISKLLAEMLGGTITVSSEKDIGSRFSLTTDIGDLSNISFVNETPSQAHKKQPETDSTTDHQRPLKAKILLAEDNIDNQSLIKLYISRTDCELDIAENGLIAVNKAQAGNYDMILMDMQMPIMDGIEATGILRKLGFKQPIIALTANASNVDTQACYDAGCSAFISKPVDREDFYQIVSKNLPTSIKTQYTLNPEQRKKLQALKQKFINGLPDTLNRIRQAIDDKDSDTLKSLLHKIKGTGGSFELPVITQIAAELEETLITTDISDMPIKIKPLEDIILSLTAESSHS